MHWIKDFPSIIFTSSHVCPTVLIIFGGNGPSPPPGQNVKVKNRVQAAQNVP